MEREGMMDRERVRGIGGGQRRTKKSKGRNGTVNDTHVYVIVCIRTLTEVSVSQGGIS